MTTETVPKKTTNVIKDKRAKGSAESSFIDTYFDLICEMAEERGVILFREVEIPSSSKSNQAIKQSTFACALCPEFFPNKEEPLFRRHIVHHFDEDVSSRDTRPCRYTFLGCRFCAADEAERIRHHTAHGSPRPETDSSVASLAPARQLLLQFPQREKHLIVDLDPTEKDEEMDWLLPTSLVTVWSFDWLIDWLWVGWSSTAHSIDPLIDSLRDKLLKPLNLPNLSRLSRS